jgi:16S rRNA (cytosine967-C5)-methyltransferase
MTDADTEAGLASRRAALQVLRRVHADDAWAAPVVDATLRRGNLEQRDRAFATNLAYETLRWEGTLDWALSTVVTRPLDQVEPVLLDILRMGAWQLLYGGTPDRAAVDTAVEITRVEAGQRATGFVNGVLRNLARAKDTLPWPSPDDDRGLGLVTGYDDWIVTAARRRFGGGVRALLEAGNRHPGPTLRAVADVDVVRQELEDAGVVVTPGRLAPEALRLPPMEAAALACVREGRAAVQDEASMVVARAAWAQRDPGGWRALDVAAAPGGKSTHLAQLGGWVAAAEIHPGRVRMIGELATRLGVADRVAVVAADGLRPPWRDQSFDVVLLDAPCTGLGIVRRRPDVRWRRESGDVRRLARLQGELLDHAARMVRPGGTLVYSVCTWTVEETADIVDAFLVLNGDLFEVDPVDVGGAPVQQPDDPGVQLTPDVHDTDGMYLCRFRRRP